MDKNKQLLAVAGILGAASLTSGCVAHGHGGYSDGYYGPSYHAAPSYYAPRPVYVPRPIYVGPRYEGGEGGEGRRGRWRRRHW
jgi:hypothetical protein